MHIVEGEIVFAALGHEHVAQPGDILVMVSGVEHAVRSVTGGVILLTVAHSESSSPIAS
jgi:quercetin dioxygenase-like cupin family protein